MAEPKLAATGRRRWWLSLRKSLFASPLDGLITLLLLAAFAAALQGVVHWALVQANWSVIVDNLPLWFTGSFTKDQVWRSWTWMASAAAVVRGDAVAALVDPPGPGPLVTAPLAAGPARWPAAAGGRSWSGTCCQQPLGRVAAVTAAGPRQAPCCLFPSGFCWPWGVAANYLC